MDLPSQLGLDLVHCERATEAVVREAGGSVVAAQGELFTQAYFDGLAAEVDELLQVGEHGWRRGVRCWWCCRCRCAVTAIAAAAGSVLQGVTFSLLLVPSLACPGCLVLRPSAPGSLDRMQEAGVASLGDLARRFALSAELVSSVVGSRVGTAIRGRLEGGLIYTPAHLARVRAQVRPAALLLLLPPPCCCYPCRGCPAAAVAAASGRCRLKHRPSKGSGI